MKIVLNFLAVTFIFISCSKDENETSPTGGFIKFYGSSHEDMGVDVISTTNGYYMLTSMVLPTQLSQLTYSKEIVFIKLNLLGNEQKRVVLGDTLDDYGNKMLLCSNSDILISGYQSLSLSDYDIFLVRLDDLGTIKWQQRFHWAGKQNVTAIAENSDGTFFMSGVTYSSMLGQVTSDMNIFIMQISENGDSLSCYIFDSQIYDDYPTDIVKLQNGNYLISCNSKSINPGLNNYNTLLIESTPEIMLQNIAMLFTNYKTIVNKLLKYQNSVYLLCNSEIQSSQTIEMVKISDFSGYLPDWRRTIAGLEGTAINDAVLASGEQLVFCGNFNQNGGDIIIGKINFDASLISKNVFGDSGSESAAAIKPINDNGFIISGTTNFESNSDIILLKVNYDLLLNK